MVTVVAGKGFNFSFPGQNFFMYVFDRSGVQTTTVLNNPGTFNGFALDDTITMLEVAPGFSQTLIENYTGLSVDAFGVPTAGTLTAIFYTEATLSTGVTRNLVSITGLNWDVAAMLQAGPTATSADDTALYASAFGGDDSFDLSNRNDATRGYAGRDKIFGNGGNDRLLGDGGADLLKGGAGHDRIEGGAGADKISGGAGDDTVAGGGGADLFQFATGDGSDVIAEFSDGLDRIDILSGATNFAGVTLIDMGNDTGVQFGGVSIRLLNVTISQVDAGDFLFH